MMRRASTTSSLFVSSCLLASFFIFFDDRLRIVGASPVVEKRDIAQYSTKYDNIDIDRILNSKRLMTNYVNCLLDKGNCTPEGAELKKYLPDALQTECSKCSPRQKKFAGKILSVLLQNYREEFWNPLVEKYDKNGIFRKKYEGGDDDYDDYED